MSRIPTETPLLHICWHVLEGKCGRIFRPTWQAVEAPSGECGEVEKGRIEKDDHVGSSSPPLVVYESRKCFETCHPAVKQSQ